MSERVTKRFLLTAVTLALLLWSAAGVTLDDPTKPPFLRQEKPVVVKAVVLKPLTLSSILFSDTRSVVVINDTVLSLGEHIEDATVLEIGRNYVVLKRRETRVSLSIAAGDEVKRSRIGATPVVPEN